MATYVTICPVCDSLIDFNEQHLYGEIECPDCAEIYKITNLDPVKLEYAYDLNHQPEYYDETYPRNS